MHLTVETTARVELVDLTDRISGEIPPDATGVCTVFLKHTSAGLLIQENEPRLKSDLVKLLESLVPTGDGYGHDDTDEQSSSSNRTSSDEIRNNTDSHLRAALLDSSLSIPVEDGELQLGTWQSVFLVELDGTRTRRVLVTVC